MSKITTFISYSRHDEKFARDLAQKLRRAGANIWMDKLDLLPGHDWEAEIEKALEDCGWFLLILSPHAAASEEVRAELNLARQMQKKVIPVLYQTCKIPFRIRHIQYCDFTSDADEGVRQLYKVFGLKDDVPQPPQNQPSPAPPQSTPQAEQPKVAKKTESHDQPRTRSTKQKEPQAAAPPKKRVPRPAKPASKPRPESIHKQRIKDLGLDFVTLEGGEFDMGDQWGDGGPDEKPVHRVKLSSFRMGRYQVTNAQFAAFLNSEGNQEEGGETWLNINSSFCNIEWTKQGFAPKSGKAQHPVVSVKWYGARAFCQWVGGRLPMEAEWEYAARSQGKKQKYPWGDAKPIADLANYDAGMIAAFLSSVGKAPLPVDSLPAGATAQGLHHMAGNVWEWCADWYGDDYYAECHKQGLLLNPTGPSTGNFRVLRGGSWFSYARDLRVANRYWGGTDVRNDFIGFRCAQDL